MSAAEGESNLNKLGVNSAACQDSETDAMMSEGRLRLPELDAYPLRSNRRENGLGACRGF